MVLFYILFVNRLFIVLTLYNIHTCISILVLGFKDIQYHIHKKDHGTIDNAVIVNKINVLQKNMNK